MGYAHLMCCLWFRVGLWSESRYGTSWMQQDRATHGVGDATADVYLRALYFCITAMTTTGLGDIKPTSPVETGFCLVLILMAIILFASLVGLFQKAWHDKDADFARFRLRLQHISSFCQRHAIGDELNSRICQHFEHIWNRSEHIDEAELLQQLPQSLRSDITLFMHRHLL